MTSNDKKKNDNINVKTDILSKKEQYELEKMKKKAKKQRTKKKVVNSKVKKDNLGSKLFAISMLVLMIGSVIISTLAYVIK